MKKNLDMLILFFLLLFLVGCGGGSSTEKIKLDAPEFEISKEGFVVLEKQENIAGYIVIINEGEEQFFDKVDLKLNDQDTIKIKCVAKNQDLYIDSDFSDIKIYKQIIDVKQKLKSPIIHILDNELYIELVEDAEIYHIYINNNFIGKTEGKEPFIILEDGIIYVIATDLDGKYLDSEKSNEVEYSRNSKKLNAPNIYIIEDKLYIESVEHAEIYHIYINDVLISSSSGKEPFIIPEEGIIYVIAAALQENYQDSEKSNVIEYITSVTTKLDIPQISLNGNILNIDPVENAQYYSIYVNDQLIMNSYDLVIEIPIYGEIYVVANAVGYISSDQSEIIVFSKEQVLLDSPNIYLDENNLLNIDPVENADIYYVYCNNEQVLVLEYTELNNIDLDFEGEIYVIASNSNNANYKDSLPSNKVIINEVKKLDTPIFNISSDGYLFINSVLNAAHYEVYRDGELLFVANSNEQIKLYLFGIYQVKAISNSLKWENSDISEEIVYGTLGPLELEIPSFIIDDEGYVIINPVENAVKYGININSSRYVEVTLDNPLQIKRGDCIMVKALPEDGTPYKASNFSALTYYYKLLDAPKLEISFEGEIYVNEPSWYVIINNSEPKLYYEGDKIQLKDGDVIKACNTRINDIYIDSEYCDPITFTLPEYIEFNSSNKITKTITNSTFKLETNKGKEVTFYVNGTITPSDNAWGSFSPNTNIYALSSTNGIIRVNCDVSCESDAYFLLSSAYNIYGKDSITDDEELTLGYGQILNQGYINDVSDMMPNYIYIANGTGYSVLSSMRVYFSNKKTVITDLDWNYDFFRAYVEGDLYRYDLESDPFFYYLIMDIYNESKYFKNAYASKIFFTDDYEVGDLKDKNGNVLDKLTRRIQLGDKIEITVGNYSKELELTVEKFEGNTLYDALPYVHSKPIGTLNTIVVPIVWNDHTYRATEEYRENLYKVLGNVIGLDGKVTSYQSGEDDVFTLSQYYKIASFNQLTINSFVTDWYEFDMSSKDAHSSDWNKTYVDNIYKWIIEKYPNIKLDDYDQDDNGFIDCLIFINTLDDEGFDFYNRISFSGAYHRFEGYTNIDAGTISQPTPKGFVQLSSKFIYENGLISNKKIQTNTLIHEFGHNLGLIDYYDTSGSFSPLGGYDMQDANVGDWNVYSKALMGWITPEIVDETDFGSSNKATFTIKSATSTGDCLIIPIAGSEYKGIFSEYIMVELFVPEGLHKYDSIIYGLNTTVGVRIYHINATMEKRILEGKNGEQCEIGTIHYSNSTDVFSSSKGVFNIELIQAGKKNTFTSYSVNTSLSANDLFKEGMKFDVSEYKEFFHNGLMDNGEEFGYIINIKSITSSDNANAVIEVIKK